ncbi:MAG: CcmD family protein [Firmicutes bacterium]|nr:CcmD family protein [Bacillota bacterium]
MVFFTLGYMIIWLLILGYTFFIHKQQWKLERELAVLEELLDEGKQTVQY